MRSVTSTPSSLLRLHRERLMAKVHSILEGGPLPALPFIRARDACPLALLHATSAASGRPPGPKVRAQQQPQTSHVEAPRARERERERLYFSSSHLG